MLHLFFKMFGHVVIIAKMEFFFKKNDIFLYFSKVEISLTVVIKI